MTCDACGEKPKNTTKDFTRAVVKIDNPETLVLLRKVSIPASMGTEDNVPAAVGKYHNVILHYEANNHTYLYSSDGIPTLLEMDIPQEIWDRIDELEEDLEEEATEREEMDEELQTNIDEVAQDLEDFKNSPDVVDIVATYADLQIYDTSALSNNDIVRVLTDETHDGASTYYRWDKENDTWEFIGITGPYYTKNEIDTTVQDIEEDIVAVQTALENKRVEAQVLTTDDFNWPENNPDGVALWKLPYGVYRNESGVKYYISTSNSGTAERLFVAFRGAGVNASTVILRTGLLSGATGNYNGIYSEHITASGITDSAESGYLVTTAQIVDNLTSDYSRQPLSAYQGKVLKGLIDSLIISRSSAPTTSTVGTRGQLYEDTANGKLYQCTAVSGSTYTWSEIGVGGSGGATELTANDYNYPTSNPDRVALWLLDNGVYSAPAGVMVAASTTSYPWYNTSDKTILVGGSDTVKGIYTFLNGKVDVVTTQVSDGTEADEYTLFKSNQVVQTTGNSTTDVMSQAAVTTELNSKANASSLATVATSGSYNDLTGTPTIPTVNDATLTIQKNGTTVQTFTANSSANKTANIEVPVITMTTTDPGEGATLAANHFIGVYE